MVKNIFDTIISLLLITILIPVFFIVSILVMIFNGFPVLFKQKRLGINSSQLNIFKFRTMTPGKSISSHHDESRITPLGKFLRKTSLDELPTLFNVIKGDMSLVGPRPLPVKYMNRFNVFQNRRHEVKPGITGWAQVNGRNTLSWEEKFEYDVYYVDHRNFSLDIKILFMTFFQMIRGRGISPTNQEIMPEFMGTEKNEPSHQN